MLSSEDKNNFGALRIIFAIIVIVSHSPEMVDGNRSREILTSLFGTLSFGELAVDGFFLVSGYLICMSMVRSSSFFLFIANRVTRIYPAFLVCTAVCVLIVAPLVTKNISYSPVALVGHLRRALTLGTPQIPGVFQGLPYQELNGAMWTIRWEFLCYLGVGALGVFGLLAPKFRYIVFITAGILLFVDAATATVSPKGFFLNAVRFGAVFLTGSTFYLYRDRIVYRHWTAALAAIALTACMFSVYIATKGSMMV